GFGGRRPEPMAVLVVRGVFSRTAVEPMAVLSEPVLALSAAAPTAVFRPPCWFKKSARKPMAMLKLPSRLAASASAPTAMFWKPRVLLASAPAPTATLNCPVVLSARASVPTAVLLIPVEAGFSAPFPNAVELPLQLLGHCAFSGGESTKQASAQTMRRSGVSFLNWRMSVVIESFFLGGFTLRLPRPERREESTEIRLSLPYPDSDPFSDGKLKVVTVREGMRS